MHATEIKLMQKRILKIFSTATELFRPSKMNNENYWKKIGGVAFGDDVDLMSSYFAIGKFAIAKNGSNEIIDWVT